MDFETQLKHINSIKFSRESLKHAAKYLQSKKETEDTPHWCKKYEDHLKLEKRGTKYIIKLFGREIIPEEGRETFLRQKLINKNSDIPFGIRSGYHRLIQDYIGITVRFLWAFLMKQEPIRKLDSRAPAPKERGHIVAKKLGMIECDLIEVTYKDLDMVAPKRKKAEPKSKKKKPVKGIIPKKDSVKKKQIEKPPEPEKVNEKAVFLIFSAVDRVTGLTYIKYSKTKEMHAISKILKSSFEFFSKALKVPIKQLRYFSDRGTEFGYMAKKTETQFYKSGVINKWIDKGAIIERRNAYIQKVFHRLRALKRKEAYPVMISRVQEIVNHTKNKNHGKSPAQIVKVIAEGNSNEIMDLIKQYNRGKRPSESDKKLNRKPLNVGDRVRLLVVKRSKDTPLGYKSYRGGAYTETTYEILGKTKKPPFRYKIKVKGKTAWKTRDSILKTVEYDKKTNAYLNIIQRKEDRDKENKKIEVAVKEIEAEKQKIANRFGKRRAHPKVFPLFIDADTRKHYRIKNMVQFEKLRKRFDISRASLKKKIVVMRRIK